MSNNGTKNGGADGMKNDGAAGIGLLVGLGLLAAGVHSSNKSKSNKKAQLQQELQEINYQLSQLKGGFFKEAWNYDQINRLESRKKEIIEELERL